MQLVNKKSTNIRKKITKERKRERLVKNFITNNIRNLNKGPYQDYPKKHFCSCSLAASFGRKHICLKLYIHFKDEEERLLFFAKRRERKKNNE